MSQITIGGTTLNFKDSAFTGDQWEQVASWVLNGGAEGIDANAQIATEKAAAASASAAAARNSATSAGESATAAANSATEAKAREDAAQSWAVGGTGTREGEDTNNAKYWAEQAHQAADGVVSFNAEIPKGRMRGDIKGTGKVGTDEDLMASQYYATQTDPANPDSWACDINGNGTINTTDLKVLLSGTLYSHPFMADYYNNWTYHKVNDTSGYWTTELSIPAITAETEGSITWGGTGFTGTFIKAEAFSGGVRIYANRPPIEALPCAVSYHTGTGGQFVIANTGVSETYMQNTVGAKYVAVSLTASGWSGEKKQTISIPGLKGDAMQQLITSTQPSTDIEKYYSAGIRISERGDNTLTFSCDTIPTANIEVVLVIIPIIGKFEG